jgi:hypothetical protein
MSKLIIQDNCANDSAVDFGRYRMGATALRRQAMQDGKRLRTACAGLLTIACAFALVLVVMAAPSPASRGLASMAQTEAPQIW